MMEGIREVPDLKSKLLIGLFFALPVIVLVLTVASLLAGSGEKIAVLPDTAGDCTGPQ